MRPDFEAARRRMVDRQISRRGVHDPLVLEAMRTVPRERFVSEDAWHEAYDDRPLPIGEGQTISQPYVVALMIQALGVGPEDKVLEVGAGSGYAAAVLGQIVREVYAMERHPSLAKEAARRIRELGYANVHVASGDGTLGWPQNAPFDAILVSAGGAAIPDALREQLAESGRLVIPVGDPRRDQELVRLVKEADGSFQRSSLGRVQFVPLVGEG